MVTTRPPKTMVKPTALGPIANTDTKLLIYGLFQKGRVLAQDGMEFLYSLNRLNVATSRAQGVCIVVASPRLLEPECRTPRQMQLANALCRYAELATTIGL